MAPPWKTAWVTGASSGIGREVALQLARAGVVVAATARNREKLDELARLHPGIHAFPADVTRLAEMRAAHAAITGALGDIDLALLNAGVWDPMSVDEFSAERIAKAMAVNFNGVTNALDPLIPAMLRRGRGQLALLSSVAGYRGLPKAAAYAPSKAAVINLAEVLRIELAGRGVTVSVVNPGFVETPMTAVNTFPMPFMLKTEDAAARIIRGLASGRFEVAFPWQMVGLLKFMRMLPYRAYFFLSKVTSRSV